MENLKIAAQNASQLQDLNCEDIIIEFLGIIIEYLCASPASFHSAWKDLFRLVILPFIKLSAPEV